MYETIDMVITGIVFGLIGFAIGMSMQRSSGSASKIATLEKQVQDEKEKNEAYKTNVAQHFTETAGLFKDLTMRYKDVHDHLAGGADLLCRDEKGNSLLTSSPIEIRIEEKSGTAETDEDIVSPPLDYAPKSDDTESGQLAEDFGLEKVKLAEDIVSDDLHTTLSASEYLAEDDHTKKA